MIDLARIAHQLHYDPETPMVFNSGLFLLLFPLFVVCYYLLRERREWRMIYVILFSYFFYYKSSGVYFVLLIAVSLVDYLLGWVIYRSAGKIRKRVYVVLSLMVNLGLLGYMTHFLPDRLEQSCSDRLVHSPLAVKVVLLVAVIFLVVQVKSSEILPFIYFQF